MNKKSNTWSTSSTTTRSWKASDLTPEQREQLDDLMASGMNGQLDGAIGSEKWRYASNDDGNDFVVEMKDGVVTVNGRTYAGLDEVPEAERKRIETLRAGFAASGSLLDMFKAGGIDAVTPPTIKGWAEGSGDDPAAAAAVDTWSAGPDETGRFAGSPGAVPKGNLLRVLSRTVLACVIVALVWTLARWFDFV